MSFANFAPGGGTYAGASDTRCRRMAATATRVMKRARQNTSIGAMKARLLSGLDARGLNSAEVPAAVVFAPADVAPRLVDTEELLDACHQVQRRQTVAPTDAE